MHMDVGAAPSIHMHIVEIYSDLPIRQIMMIGGACLRPLFAGREQNLFVCLGGKVKRGADWFPQSANAAEIIFLQQLSQAVPVSQGHLQGMSADIQQALVSEQVSQLAHLRCINSAHPHKADCPGVEFARGRSRIWKQDIRLIEFYPSSWSCHSR